MKRIRALFDTEGGVRLLWWLIGGLVVVGFFVFLAVGANGPDDPSLSVRESTRDFGTIAFTVEHGSVTDEFCALLAATDAQRQTGMTGRKDLSGHDAMVFAYPAEIDAGRVFFHNHNVPIDLSLAWFDGAGTFVSATDMASCGLAALSDCPTYRSTGRWQFALEVPKGGLGRLGISPGAVMKLGVSGC